MWNRLLSCDEFQTTKADCVAIKQACEQSEVMLAVCHVLRYYPPNKKLKELIESGVIGDIVNIQHTEPVPSFILTFFMNLQVCTVFRWDFGILHIPMFEVTGTRKATAVFHCLQNVVMTLI